MVRDGAEFTIGPRFARTRWRLLTMRPIEAIEGAAGYAAFAFAPTGQYFASQSCTT
jgi:hypothetical protein